MIFFDIITLAVIGWMVFKGLQSGFIAQLFNFIGITIGVTLAISYGEDFGELLHISREFAAIFGFLIILIVTVIIAFTLSKILSKTVAFAGLDWLNNILGVLFSVLQGLVLLSMAYAAIYGINERLKIIEPTSFNKSISFNIVRKVANPLLDYWEETKPDRD